jgi:hypothetical protein
MASIADGAGPNRHRPKALGQGSFTNPRGALSKIWARSHFVNAINAFAPTCLADLRNKLPSARGDRERPDRFVDPRGAREAIAAWCRRWNLDTPWMRGFAGLSLQGYQLCLWEHADADACRFRLVDRSWLYGDAELTSILEGVNPGWHDDEWVIQVPAFFTVWRRTRTLRGAIRDELHDTLERIIGPQLGAGEADMRASGSTATPRPLPDDFFEWVVRDRVNSEAVKAIARSAKRSHQAIYNGIRRVEDLLELPPVDRSGRGGRPRSDVSIEGEID